MQGEAGPQHGAPHSGRWGLQIVFPQPFLALCRQGGVTQGARKPSPVDRTASVASCPAPPWSRRDLGGLILLLIDQEARTSSFSFGLSCFSLLSFPILYVSNFAGHNAPFQIAPKRSPLTHKRQKTAASAATPGERTCATLAAGSRSLSLLSPPPSLLFIASHTPVALQVQFPSVEGRRRLRELLGRAGAWGRQWQPFSEPRKCCRRQARSSVMSGGQVRDFPSTARDCSKVVAFLLRRH
ncbi:uncharacterized protein [Macaca nemestrina]|uniref:uncharacterized protein n=1 Tax=Macaca nemestrina TaxID=9545 RepID=UPI0039B85F84